MGSRKSDTPSLKDTTVDVKVKLSALWVSVMLLYVYVDIFGLYEPGSIQGILEGRVWKVEITQTWALSALLMMAIPTLMVVLSLLLPASANRWTNIIVGALYIVISVGNAVGESWIYYWLGSAVEAILLALVVWFAVKWPRTQDAAE